MSVTIAGNSNLLLQVASTTRDGAFITSNAGVPSTITNGTQVFSLNFTPVSATSTILVMTNTIVLSEEANTGDICWLALWDGSTFICASSGGALFNHFGGNLQVTNASICNSYAAGSTTTRTIQIRAGVDAGAVWVNGNSSYNYTGSSSRIQMTVMEIAG
jgi:hypothetical protein